MHSARKSSRSQDLDISTYVERVLSFIFPYFMATRSSPLKILVPYGTITWMLLMHRIVIVKWEVGVPQSMIGTGEICL